MNTSSTVSTVSEFEAEYAATAADRAALPDTALVPVNLDINVAVAAAAKAERALATFRPQVAQMPGVDMATYDKISTYARALAAAQAHFTAASTPSDQLLSLIDRAGKLREILLAEVKAIVARGVIDRRPLDSLKGGNGYSSIATDLATLSTALLANPDALASATIALANEAKGLSEKIIWQFPQRGVDPTAVSAASVDRQRAFTLFAHASDEARRAVTFLRWHENDADELLPSLYAGRKSRSKADATPEPSAPVDVVAPTAPAPTTPAVAPGMPGSSPFTNN